MAHEHWNVGMYVHIGTYLHYISSVIYLYLVALSLEKVSIAVFINFLKLKLEAQEKGPLKIDFLQYGTHV